MTTPPLEEATMPPMPSLPALRVPPDLERRTTEAAVRAMPQPWTKRVPDLVLTAYCLGELLYALRVVHVIP